MLIAAGANVLLRTLLAPACAACGALLDRPVESPVCPVCWRSVAPVAPPVCVCCGEPLRGSEGPHCARCDLAPPAFVLARSAGLYEGPLRDVIHAYKFERRRLLALPLAALMRRAGADVLAAADAVVPVPLHPWRAFRRGFNQADDLAVRLGPPVWRVLRRRRGGPPQSALAGAARRANVSAAFAAKPGATRRLRGATVVLVDDVITTGATLDACARACGAAGVRRVVALTLARTAARRGPRPARQPPPHPSTVRRR